MCLLNSSEEEREKEKYRRGNLKSPGTRKHNHLSAIYEPTKIE